MDSNNHATPPAIVRRLRSWPRRLRLEILAALTLAALLTVLVLPPIPQPQRYHSFADPRGLLGAPHFLNIVSNAALVLAGAAGLSFLLRRCKSPGAGVFAQPWERSPYVVFFLGALLTGLGSAWYHRMPDTEQLTWDRLPMTLIFMSFLAAAFGERISSRAARLGLAPLLVLGMASVILWHVGELRGGGDLRLYGFVQFYTAFMVPVIVLLFPCPFRGDRAVLEALGIYALAMLCGELLDAQIFALGQIVSGHTLKHLLAGAAAYRVLRMLRARRR